IGCAARALDGRPCGLLSCNSEMSACPLPSQIARLEQRLGTVANAKDVDGVVANLEEDAVNSPPFAVQQLANLSGEPLAFWSKPTPFRLIFEGANGFHELPVPAGSGLA